MKPANWMNAKLRANAPPEVPPSEGLATPPKPPAWAAGGVEGTTSAGAGVGARGPGEVRIEVGAEQTIFGRGTRIDVEVFAGASEIVVAQPVLLTCAPLQAGVP